MTRKRYDPEEYPVFAKAEKTERDANGNVVRAFSQLDGDERIAEFDDTTNWAGYNDPTYPRVIEDMQRVEREWIDHLLSHLNDE